MLIPDFLRQDNKIVGILPASNYCWGFFVFDQPDHFLPTLLSRQN